MSYIKPHKLRAQFFQPGGIAVALPEGPPQTLEEAITGFAAHVRRGGAKPQTIEHYEIVLRHGLDLPYGWPLTIRVMEQWRDEQLKLADATQFARWHIMRQFVTWLIKRHAQAGIPMVDPMEDLPKPKRPKPTPYKKTATAEEVEALLRTCDRKDWWDHRLWVLIQLLRNSGLRIGEALKLRWRHITWNSPVLGEVELLLEPEDPDEVGATAQKSDSADDFAHITEPAFSALRDWRKRLARDGMDGPDQWVFPVTIARGMPRTDRPKRYRTSHWSISHVWQMFVALSFRARLTRPIHPHMLRHTAGTEFAIKTGDLEATRLFMRHSDYGMVKAYLNTKQTREHMMAQHRKVAMGGKQ